MEILRKLIVIGNVQLVGFRQRVWKRALRLKITGTVRNLEDGNVELICKGDENNYEELKSYILSMEGVPDDDRIIRVENFFEETENIDESQIGDYFKIIHKAEEHNDATELGLSFIGNMEHTFDGLLETYGEINGTMNAMSKDIRGMSGDIRGMREDISGVSENIKILAESIVNFTEETKTDIKKVVKYLEEKDN